jgi:hypothetical protein
VDINITGGDPLLPEMVLADSLKVGDLIEFYHDDNVYIVSQTGSVEGLMGIAVAVGIGTGHSIELQAGDSITRLELLRIDCRRKR